MAASDVTERAAGAGATYEPDGAREQWPAVLVALFVGVATVALVFGRRRRAPAPSDATTAGADGHDDQALQRRRGLARGFVRARITAARHVLFVAGALDAIAPFVALFDALDADLDVVDLSRVAGGRQVAAELRGWREDGAEGEDGEDEEGGAGTDEVGQQAFFFIGGALRGDWALVRQQLLARELEDAIPAARWERVRLDPRSDRGFDVKTPGNAFQSLAGTAVEQDASSKLETKPLRSLVELRGVDLSLLARCTVPLAARSREQARRSKLLVCHDMKGGYLDDRFRQGSDAFEAYRFYQWDLVDTFVYFSHALVTIPPVGWVLASHRHGARTLGSFVTEGDAGRELVTELFVDMYAAKLVAIAWRAGFDGWLVNLETDVPATLVPNIQTFLRVLRRGLQANNPDAQLIWYGCLGKDGKRKHQVRLDESSVDFFRHVDGFYTDYGWTSDDAKFSAAFNLDRRYDVYMGIDVFGRHGTVGGGKLNCDSLLRLAWNSGVSAALFAPGWTYECYQHEAQLPFVAAEDAFWQRLRAAWKVRSPCFDALGGANCFYSALNSGHGHGVWVNGDPVSSAEWSNMGEMDVQPSSALHYGVQVATSEGQLTASIAHATAFHGGSSVMLTGKLNRREKKYFKLFNVDIVFTPRRIMEISYATTSNDSSACLLVLTVCPGVDHATHQIILSSGAIGSGSQPTTADTALSSVLGLRAGRHFFAPVSTEIFGGSTPVGWVRKTYRLGGQLWDEKHLVEIGVLCTAIGSSGGKGDEQTEYEAYLGEVCVVGCENGVARPVPRSARDEPKRCINPRVASMVRLEKSDEAAIGVEWELSTDGEPVHHVLVYLCSYSDQSGTPVRRMFVGKSFDQSFWVERCPLPELVGGESSSSHAPPIVATFELQSVSWSGQLSSSVCRLHLEE